MEEHLLRHRAVEIFLLYRRLIAGSGKIPGMFAVELDGTGAAVEPAGLEAIGFDQERGHLARDCGAGHVGEVGGSQAPIVGLLEEPHGMGDPPLPGGVEDRHHPGRQIVGGEQRRIVRHVVCEEHAVFGEPAKHCGEFGQGHELQGEFGLSRDCFMHQFIDMAKEYFCIDVHVVLLGAEAAMHVTGVTLAGGAHAQLHAMGLDDFRVTASAREIRPAAVDPLPSGSNSSRRGVASAPAKTPS